MGKLLLECNHISFSYHTPTGEISAIKNMSFAIKEGEFVSLVGPSGCGKSTLLHLLIGLLEPEDGNITLYYEPNHISSHSQAYYGYMPQQDQLFEWFDIFTNVTLSYRINHNMNQENVSYINSLLKRYGLYEFRHKKPSELSGGMRQRAALIRTLAMKPSLLYLDEPFSALDYQNRLKAANDIGQIIQREKKTALLVTHDIAEAISLSSRILVLSSKPASIQKEIILPYQAQKLTAMEVRNSANFQDYFNLVWKELNQ